MNNDRRKMITASIEKIEEALADVTTAGEEETGYGEDCPENMYDCEKYETAREVGCNLEEIASELDDIKGRLEEAAQ